MSDAEFIDSVVQRVREAAAKGQRLRPRGSGSKDFYGEPVKAQADKPIEALALQPFQGILQYEPSELFVRARAGTGLAQLQAVLAEQGQWLPFDPPHFGAGATLGGAFACGLCGPTRASLGAWRDYVLGVTMVNGKGEVLNFGGQVMKNVAGFDVSRMLVGSMGRLGVILDVSLKVLPGAAHCITLRRAASLEQSITHVNQWLTQGLPVACDTWLQGIHTWQIRAALPAAQQALQFLTALYPDASVLPEPQAAQFWQTLREQKLAFFDLGPQQWLWRVSIPATAAFVTSTEPLSECFGAIRWVKAAAGDCTARTAALAVGGHATLFRAAQKTVPVFSPNSPVLARITENIRRSFDPDGVFAFAS